jgi:hypothetical protein
VGGKTWCQRTRGKKPHWSFSPTPARPHRSQHPAYPARTGISGRLRRGYQACRYTR